MRTISVAVASFIGEFTTEWNLVMAAAAVGTMPVVIVFLFFQNQLMQGLTGGAVKGNAAMGRSVQASNGSWQGGAGLSERHQITGVRTVAVGAGWRNYVFVLIDTDDGLTGLGEASLGGQTHAVLGAIKDLEPLLIGADPFRIEHIWQQAYRHAFWHGGPTFLSALAGVEVALWDIKGQALGVPDLPAAGRAGPRPDPRLRQRSARRHAG